MRITGYENNQTILAELGQRIKDTRIAAGYSQSELAQRSGISSGTLVRMEMGEAVSTEKLLNVLRALDALSNLELVLPEQTIRPVDLADQKAKPQRVSRKRTKSKNTEWVWGEDK